MEFVIIGVFVVQALLMGLWVRACTRETTRQIDKTLGVVSSDASYTAVQMSGIRAQVEGALARLPKSRSKKSAQPPTVL